jgi:hypothetical protein
VVVTSVAAGAGLVGAVVARAAQGATARRIAADLGVDLGMVDAALDVAWRLGMVVTSGDAVSGSCTSCPTAEAVSLRSVACAGCPFAR